MMPETGESRKPAEISERNQSDARDRSRLDAGADQVGREARQVGERSVEAAKRTAETTADATRRTAEVAADITRRVFDQGPEAAIRSLRAIAGVQRPLADAGFEQSRRVLETTARITDVYREGSERAANDVHALFDAGVNFGRGLQRWQHAYFELLQQSVGSVARKQQDLLRSNSPVEFAEVQRDLYVDLVRNASTANATLLHLTGQIVHDAVRPLEQRART
jgi:hypothetical protein